MLLGKEEWLDVLTEQNTDIAYDNLITSFRYYFDIACPLRKKVKKVKGRKVNWNKDTEIYKLALKGQNVNQRLTILM